MRNVLFVLMAVNAVLAVTQLCTARLRMRLTVTEGDAQTKVPLGDVGVAFSPVKVESPGTDWVDTGSKEIVGVLVQRRSAIGVSVHIFYRSGTVDHALLRKRNE